MPNAGSNHCRPAADCRADGGAAPVNVSLVGSQPSLTSNRGLVSGLSDPAGPVARPCTVTSVGVRVKVPSPVRGYVPSSSIPPGTGAT